eukprot:CFRG6327T1
MARREQLHYDGETLLSHDNREDILPPGYGDHDIEGGDADMPTFKSFDESYVRHGFIRKVYAILFCQLMTTACIVGTFLYAQPLHTFVQQNTWTIWIAFAITIGLIVVMSCYEDARRRSPYNYLFLGAFTLAESYIMGVITTTYEADQVLLALGITMVLVVGLTAFAFQTKYDFTMLNGILFSCLIALIIFGFLNMFIRNRVADLIYSSLGALLFSVYIIYDTQKIIGGEHKLSISPEEYVFAALALYLDIINLFLYILRALSNSRT